MKKALALLAVLAMALPATAQTLPQDPYGKPSTSGTPSPGAPVDPSAGGSTTAPSSGGGGSMSPSSPSGGGMAPMSPSSPSSPSGMGSMSSDKPSSPADPSMTSKPAGSDSAGTMMKPDDKTQTTGEKPAEDKPSGKQYRARTAPAPAPKPAAPSS